MTTPEIGALRGAKLNIAIAEAKGWRGGRFRPDDNAGRHAYFLIRPSGKIPPGCDELPLSEAVANSPTFGVYDLADSIPAWATTAALAYDLREEMRAAGLGVTLGYAPGGKLPEPFVLSFWREVFSLKIAHGADENEASGRGWLMAHHANALTAV